MIIPKEFTERGDRIETLLVDIKRLLEVMTARQLVQIEIADPQPQPGPHTFNPIPSNSHTINPHRMGNHG